MVWESCKLGELFEIKHGFAFKGEFFSDVGKKILLTPGNFNASGGLKLKGDKEKYYLGEFPEDYLLKKGDMLVAMTDLTQNAPILGSPLIIPENNIYLHNQRLGRIINLANERVYKDFLYHLLNTNSVREQIKGSATGATVRHTAPSRIYDVSVKLPPLAEQKEIAAILSSYNKLIENNTRRITILETMAQNLYREWFVNFRFPGHEQSQWQDTPQGKIPAGWELKTATEVINFAPKIRVPKEGAKPFVSMPNISTDTMLIDEIEWREGNSGTKFQNGDTLLARITPCLQNGKTAFVQFLDEENPIGLGSTEFIVMRSKTLTPEFVYCLARSGQFRGHAINSMAGADGRQRVKNDCFDAYYLAVPPRELFDRFEVFAKPIFEQVFNLSKKNKNLKQQRDILLQKLIVN